MSDTDSRTSVDATQEADIVAALGKRAIVLVGMMGAGKSTIGRRLAARLHLSFVDADAEIEEAHRMSIPEIFEAHGEPYFRSGEARVIARLLESGPSVLATGGGAFMREETRVRIRDKAVSIWLKADLEVLARRVSRKDNRPLLAGKDPMQVLREQAEARYPAYGEADIVVETGDAAHHVTVDQVIKALSAHLEKQAS